MAGIFEYVHNEGRRPKSDIRQRLATNSSCEYTRQAIPASAEAVALWYAFSAA